MNAKQKTQIAEWIDTLENIKGAIEDMRNNEQEKFDNLPEGLQECELGERLQDAADNLEDAADSLDEIIETLVSLRLSIMRN